MPEQSPHNDIRRLLKGTDPEIRELLITAHRQHFSIRRTSNDHFMVRVPRQRSGGHTRSHALVPSKSGSPHNVANTRADLRRIGVRFPRP